VLLPLGAVGRRRVACAAATPQNDSLSAAFNALNSLRSDRSAFPNATARLSAP